VPALPEKANEPFPDHRFYFGPVFIVLFLYIGSHKEEKSENQPLDLKS